MVRGSGGVTLLQGMSMMIYLGKMRMLYGTELECLFLKKLRIHKVVAHGLKFDQ